MNDRPDFVAIDPTDPAASRAMAPTSPLEQASTPPPGFAPPPRRPRRWAVLIAVLIIAAILMGVAIGYGFWGASGQTSSTSPPSGGSGSTGSAGSPNGYGSGGSPYGYGNGSPYGYVTPNGYGSGGSSSNSGSSGSGGPTNVSSIASAVSPGLVDINVTLAYQNGEAAATGIVLNPSGEVLTNNHVVEGAGAISATDVGNGKTYKATVVGYDRSHDVALLQLSDASGLQTASLGDSSTVAVGQAIVAIGNAGGAGGKPSAAGGSVTALNQKIVADGAGGSERLSGLIEVNADVQPGDSGGPLVDGAGKTIGIDTAASVGFSFRSAGGGGDAVPVNQALAIAKQIENGVSSTTVHVGPTAFLGVELAASAGQDSFGQGSGFEGGSSASGATVAGVLPGSAAEQAGLRSGDVITSLGGQRVGSATALTSLVGDHRPGDRVQMKWVDQSGKSHTATVTLATGPAA
jgi:S1-C subfamily serine protease